MSAVFLPDETDGIKYIGKWRAGDIANLEEVRAGAIKIADKLRSDGYLKVTQKTEHTVHENNHTVDALITVTAGPQYHFGKLTIDGLDLLTEPQIRKAWMMPHGLALSAELCGFVPERPSRPGWSVSQKIWARLERRRISTRKAKIVDVESCSLERRSRRRRRA